MLIALDVLKMFSAALHALNKLDETEHLPPEFVHSCIQLFVAEVRFVQNALHIQEGQSAEGCALSGVFSALTTFVSRHRPPLGHVAGLGKKQRRQEDFPALAQQSRRAIREFAAAHPELRLDERLLVHFQVPS